MLFVFMYIFAMFVFAVCVLSLLLSSLVVCFVRFLIHSVVLFVFWCFALLNWPTILFFIAFYYPVLCLLYILEVVFSLFYASLV